MKNLIFLELMLIIATVPVFRAGWWLLDSFDWLNEPFGILVSLAAGLLFSGIALSKINSKKNIMPRLSGKVKE